MKSHYSNRKVTETHGYQASKHTCDFHCSNLKSKKEHYHKASLLPDIMTKLEIVSNSVKSAGQEAKPQLHCLVCFSFLD